MDFRKNMKEYMELEIKTIQSLNIDELNEVANALVDCRKRGGVVYTMGNGGSAATASHFVCDFSKGVSETIGGNKFLFECLSDNMPIVMAIANDISYDDVFAFQLKDKLKKEDLILAISGSGNSKNIIKAVEYAKIIGTPIIGITGYRGGKLKEMSDYIMHVNIDDMQIAEDVHMMFDHMLMRVICQAYSKMNYLKE